jgi:hypothetical protein
VVGTSRRFGAALALGLVIRAASLPLPGHLEVVIWKILAVKPPVLIANIGLTGLFFVVVRRVSGRDEPARWAALAYWLNPATIFGGEMLGYVDPLYFLPAIAALALAHFQHPWWASI